MFAQRFDGRDLVIFGLRGQQRSRVDRFAVQQNCVRARKPVLIAKFSAVKTQSTQSGEECRMCRRFDLVVNAVDVEGDVHCGSL